MWQYSDILMDHFMNPRNVGTLENPDGHAEVGSPQCGDAMFLDVEIDDDGRIRKIAFKTFGCAGAIASASALTEMVQGLSVEEALKVRNSQVADYLGGMPPEKFHCSVMGHQALKAAIEDFRQKCSEISSALTELGVEPILVRPSRVRLRAGGDTTAVAQKLEEKLGRKITVEVQE